MRLSSLSVSRYLGLHALGSRVLAGRRELREDGQHRGLVHLAVLAGDVGGHERGVPRRHGRVQRLGQVVQERPGLEQRGGFDGKGILPQIAGERARHAALIVTCASSTLSAGSVCSLRCSAIAFAADGEPAAPVR